MTAPALVRVFAVCLAVGLTVGLPALVLSALRGVLRRRYSAAGCSTLWTGLALLLLVLPALILSAQALRQLPVRYTPAPQSSQSAPHSAEERRQEVPSPAPKTDGQGADPVHNGTAGSRSDAPPTVFAPILPEFIAETAVITGTGARLLHIAALVWLAGVGIGACVTALHYACWKARCRRWLQPVPPKQQQLYAEVCTRLGVRRAPRLQCSAWVRTPLLAGVVRPVLVLPACRYEDGTLALIFTHELIHLQRRDVLRQLLLTAAGTLHWYDPAVWLLNAAARRDAEQATDAAVLALAGNDPSVQYSAAYGEALLQSMARARSLPLATGFSAPKKELKERMKHLFDPRPGRRGRALTAALLCVTLAAALLAGCAANALRVEAAPDPLSMTESQTPAQQLDSQLQEQVESSLASGGQSLAAVGDGQTVAVVLPEEIGSLQWPVPDSEYIAKNFTGLYTHNGIDIAADLGSAIVAADDGMVTHARYDDVGYGNYIVLQHSGALSTLYAHCGSLAVAVGDTVTAGQVIGYVGSSGSAEYNHCHFELRINNVQTDPLEYVEPVYGPDAPQPDWTWPVPGYAYCSRGFTGTAKGSHDGLDLAASYDTPIVAATNGTVLEAEYTSVGDGVYVVLDHGNGITTRYAHCSRLAVEAGDTVKTGEVIAWVGSTGNSTGNHCHFTVCVDGVAVDPAEYVGHTKGSVEAE